MMSDTYDTKLELQISVKVHRTILLRPWTTGNTVLHHVQFLVQTFASYDLKISSGAMGINYVYPEPAIFIFWMSLVDLYIMNL